MYNNNIMCMLLQIVLRCEPRRIYALIKHIRPVQSESSNAFDIFLYYLNFEYGTFDRSHMTASSVETILYAITIKQTRQW